MTNAAYQASPDDGSSARTIFDSASPSHVAAEAQRLRQAQRAWRGAGLLARLEALQALADAIARRRAELVEALIGDTRRVAASEAEVDACGHLVARWAELASALLSETPLQQTTTPMVYAAHQRVPYSLVAVVTPWNSPLGLSLLDAIPALVAGCAVMIKPSEVTQGFLAPLRAAVAEVPALADILSLLGGAGDVAEAMIAQADAVCFTGSVETGRKVATAAAARLIPAFLELGGKDPAIVMAGADLRRASRGIAWSGTFNSGQLCHSIERVYVEASVAEEFIPLLVTAVSAHELAFPAPTDGELGPFINPAQAQIVSAHLDDALAKGARVLSGGILKRHEGQIWCVPTVLADVDHDMLIMREETFGPILPVMTVPDATTALRLANDSPYGLSASIWGEEAAALALARELNAGAVSINDASLAAVLMDQEKQAFGVSGLGGSRMGPAALLRFTRIKALLSNRRQDDSSWW